MRLHSSSDTETREIGRKIGDRIGAGDVVCLFGELGAGKTTMVKGIASAFGIDERDITSASFTIVAEHEGRLPFYHIDLYRLQKGDIDELGLHEYIWSDGVTVIEWAERLGGDLPADAVKVRIGCQGETGRDIEIEGIDI
jgi:tRNA threonylcarbamoyladenosine biosynthesis protein TsaE